MMTAYRHIQYIQLEQIPPAKWGHISKGTLYLLASSGNQAQNIPFFSEKKDFIPPRKALASGSFIGVY